MLKNEEIMLEEIVEKPIYALVEIRYFAKIN
jgi:hypothetical protein